MNQIIVIENFDGTQQLADLQSFFRPFRSMSSKELEQAFIEKAAALKAKEIRVMNMDGTRSWWLVKAI